MISRTKFEVAWTRLWYVILSLGLVCPLVARSDVGPDILVLPSLKDRDALLLFADNVSLAAQEGNRIAQVIANEARVVVGMEPEYSNIQNNSRVPAGLHAETEKEWISAVTQKAGDGDTFYMEVMGILCWNGFAGVPMDRKKGLAWWEKAAGLNCGLAKLRLGACHMGETRANEWLPYDVKKAEKYFREAGELGIPRGWFELGCLYDGEYGLVRDLNKAIECWNKSARQGHVLSQFYLAYTYCYGEEGFVQNKELGVPWMAAAASNGHSSAQYYMTNYVGKNPVQRKLPAIIEDKRTEVVSSFIAYDEIMESIKDPKLSLVCFVDIYEPNTPKPATLWEGSLREIPQPTPCQMLDKYLTGVRSIKRQQNLTATSIAINPDEVKIFILTCWDDTRAKVREFDKNFKLQKHDGRIPVIYVFHKGKLVGKYTLYEDLGEEGGNLKSLAENLVGGRDPMGVRH